jgi:nitrogen regulatory protein P-II 2
VKYIIAIVQPSRLEAVKDALSEIEVFRLTVSDVQGVGRQKGHTEVYRGHEYQINFIRKVKLEIAVDDRYVGATVDAITNAARTGAEGKIGDGKIFILPLEDAVRIRTGERGVDAL